MHLLATRLRGRLLGLLLPLLFRVRPRPDLEKLGSDYGGWIVPTSLLAADWVVYSGGVGEDITFDLAVIDRFGCTVHAFDPTPRAIAHVEAIAPPPAFHLHPYGLWDADETLRFYAPRDPAHVSHSALNLQQTDAYFEAPVRSLVGLVDGVSEGRVDLLKLDIEGAEHRVLAEVAASALRPTVICVEFDQPVPLRRVRDTSRRLQRVGYRRVAVDRWNHTFVLGGASA